VNNARSHFLAPDPAVEPTPKPTAVLIVLAPDEEEADDEDDEDEDNEDEGEVEGCSFSTKYSSSEVRSGVIAISRMRSRRKASMAAS
jgi:hypothetical protein